MAAEFNQLRLSTQASPSVDIQFKFMVLASVEVIVPIEEMMITVNSILASDIHDKEINQKKIGAMLESVTIKGMGMGMGMVMVMLTIIKATQ